MYRVPRAGIGSEFYLPLSHLFWRKRGDLHRYTPELPESRRVFLSSGRGAINFIIRMLGLSEGDEVLLPAYLCEEALKPFLEKSVKVRFYRLDENLGVDEKDLEKRISRKTRVVFLIHYFGFPQRVEEIAKLCKEHETLLVEDCVQSFLTLHEGKPLGSFSDMSFTSFRKWLPIADGSLLSVNNPELGIPMVKRNSTEHRIYVLLRRLGLNLKGVHHSVGKVPINLAEMFLRTEAVEMSGSSKRLLYRFNLERVIERRKKNFGYLLENLDVEGIKPLFGKLPRGVCPLGFPIIAENREDVKRRLIRERIYPPIHWMLPDEISKGGFPISWNISKRILTIPIDQRYKTEDMESITKVLNR